MYQQINLSDHNLVGSPGPAPENLAGLHDEILADVGRYIVPPPPDMEGQGWWPVITVPPASFDPASQVIVDPASFTADPATATVRGQQATRAMTDAEFAVANPVPESVSNYQARQALIDAGLFAKVNAAIEGADQSVKANLEAFQAWEYANNFYRNQPFVMSLGPSLGLSQTDIDNLFRAAAKVT